MASVALLHTDSTVRMLLERLTWPVRFTRWLAARDFGELLASGPYNKRATAAYLKWLEARKFESQIASGLAVLCCTPEKGLPSFSEVCAHINRPSIIADVMLQHVYGFGRKKGGWQNAHSGLAPASFKPGAYFDDNKGAQVPRIFTDYIRKLESDTGFPFMQQWAFEWQNLMDATKSPYSDFPYYFIGPRLQRSGIMGQFSQTQCDVLRSAYLRTLAFAVFQGMSLADAVDRSTLCLPLNRELSRLKPIERPKWLTDIPEQCCVPDAPLERLARELINAKYGQEGMRWVKISTPIKASLYEFGDLSISAVLVSDDFVPNPDDKYYFDQHTGWPLPDTISFRGGMPQKDPEDFGARGMQGWSLPICLSLWPHPSGFWHNDYLSLGLALPATYNFPRAPVIECGDQSINVESGGVRIASLSIWHDQWTPLYPPGGQTRCGLVTGMREFELEQSRKHYDAKLGWVVQLRLWSRKKDYGDYEVSVRREFFRDIAH
jgi:hypothetical protein